MPSADQGCLGLERTRWGGAGTLLCLQIAGEWMGGWGSGRLTEQPRSHRPTSHRNNQREWGKGGQEGAPQRESPRAGSKVPRDFQPWEKLELTGNVAWVHSWCSPGSWSLCWSMHSRFSRRRSTWALIWLSSPLMECSSSVWTVWRGARAGAHQAGRTEDSAAWAPPPALNAKVRPALPQPCR